MIKKETESRSSKNSNWISNICLMEDPQTQWPDQMLPISNEHIGSILWGFSHAFYTFVLHTCSLIWRLFSFHLKREQQGKGNVPHSHLLSFGLWTGSLWLSRPRLLAFRRVCWQGVTANLTRRKKGTGKKKEGVHVLHQFSSLWPSDWTLSVAGSNFAESQLRPAGCALGVPSVVWELCLQDTPVPGGFYTL